MLVISTIFGIFGVVAPISPSYAAGTVGDGVPSSCTENALFTTLAGGGSVTFNCGSDPVTIAITSTKWIQTDTTVDGGSKITILGRPGVRIFNVVGNGSKVELRNITLAEGACLETAFCFDAGPIRAGGAIYADWGTFLTVTNVTFWNNRAEGDGGAIFNRATLAINNSAFVLNAAGAGGAVYNQSTVTISGSTFTGNSAGIGGAVWSALFVLGPTAVRITSSTFRENVATFRGGALYSLAPTTIVLNSTFVGNRTSQGTGGAIHTDGGPSLQIVNSTISENYARDGGGGIYNGYDIQLRNVTIARNSAVSGGGGLAQFASPGQTSLRHVLLAENVPANCGGSQISGDRNIATDASCSGSGIRVDSPAIVRLGPLADNGGPTLTHALLAGSSAIDYGWPPYCDVAPPSGAGGKDQRGLTHLGACDIGSFEFGRSFNSPPSVTVTLNPTAPRTADILIAVAATVDQDGNNVTLTYVWKRNGVTTKTTAATPNLTDSYDLGVWGNGDRGDLITVEVTPYDGVANGQTVSSAATVANSPPTVNLNAPVEINEASGAVLTTFPDDPDGDPVTVVWTMSGSGALSPDGNSATYTAGDGPSSADFKVDVTDTPGAVASAKASITIRNVAPDAIIEVVNPRINEGSSSPVAFSNPSDPSSADIAAGLHYAFACDGSTLSSAIYASSGSANSTICSFADNGSFIVRGRVIDKDNGFAERSITIVIDNVVPVVGSITVPAEPLSVYAAINVSGTFSDSGTIDTHSAVWHWGDSATTVGSISENSGSGTVTGSHTYAAPGVYNVRLTVTDDDGGSGSGISEFIVIYDPNGGSVTGGGWISSPAGAYTADPALSGRATFGFVSKYLRGQTTPDGSTEFQFRAANFNFRSNIQDWLVVSGARAQYRGKGTINGQENYDFMLTVIDGQQPGGGGQDRLHLRIWGSAGVIYDNQLNAPDTADPTTALGGGSIVIHPN